METLYRRQGRKRANQIGGPLSLLIAAAKPLSNAVGLAGVPDDTETWTKWLDDPDILRLCLIALGLWFTAAGYQDSIRRWWHAARFRVRLFGYRGSSIERRQFASRSIGDSLITRGESMLRAEDHTIDWGLFEQWLSHIRSYAHRVTKRAANTSYTEDIDKTLDMYRVFEESCRRNVPDRPKLEGVQEARGMVEQMNGLIASFRDNLQNDAVRCD